MPEAQRPPTPVGPAVLSRRLLGPELAELQHLALQGKVNFQITDFGTGRFFCVLFRDVVSIMNHSDYHWWASR